MGLHPDGKRQSGSCATIGNGAVLSSSSKQKLTAKSSQESEAISTSDKLNNILWLRNLLIAQGEKVGPVIVYQDNKGVLEVCKRGQNTRDDDCGYLDKTVTGTTVYLIKK